MIWFIAFLFLVVAWLLWALVRPTLFTRRLEKALRQFERNRGRLEAELFEAAATSGKPRGLKWKQCGFQPGLVLARDRANGDIVGLVGVSVSFDAVEGGAMEDVEAVGNLRAATAVFTHDGSKWATQGRVVFNLEPREVLTRYKSSLDAL